MEYDVDSVKHFDIDVGGAYEIVLAGSDSEKLRVRLASNAIEHLEQLYKVKIEAEKNRIDVEICRDNALSKAQGKEALYVFITLPAKYLAGVEIGAHVNVLRLSNLEAETVEFDGKAAQVFLTGVKGNVELNASTDLTVVCDGFAGGVGVNQLSATSTIHVPKGTVYQIRKKGRSNRVSHTLDVEETTAPDPSDTENFIKLSSLGSELIVNECTDISKLLG